MLQLCWLPAGLLTLLMADLPSVADETQASQGCRASAAVAGVDESAPCYMPYCEEQDEDGTPEHPYAVYVRQAQAVVPFCHPSVDCEEACESPCCPQGFPDLVAHCLNVYRCLGNGCCCEEGAVQAHSQAAAKQAQAVARIVAALRNCSPGGCCASQPCCPVLRTTAAATRSTKTGKCGPSACCTPCDGDTCQQNCPCSTAVKKNRCCTGGNCCCVEDAQTDCPCAHKCQTVSGKTVSMPRTVVIIINAAPQMPFTAPQMPFPAPPVPPVSLMPSHHSLDRCGAWGFPPVPSTAAPVFIPFPAPPVPPPSMNGRPGIQTLPVYLPPEYLRFFQPQP